VSKSKFNSLPVPPEFVESLAENAMAVATAYLRKIEAPAEVVELVEHIYNLGYYMEVAHSRPEILMGDEQHRFGIETIVIETISAIGKLGGEFYGPYTHSRPRKGAPLAEKAE